MCHIIHILKYSLCMKPLCCTHILIMFSTQEIVTFAHLVLFCAHRPYIVHPPDTITLTGHYSMPL